MTTPRTCDCGLVMVPCWRAWSGTTQIVAACPTITIRHGIHADGKLGPPWRIDTREHQVWVKSKPGHPRSCCYIDRPEGGHRRTSRS